MVMALVTSMVPATVTLGTLLPSSRTKTTEGPTAMLIPSTRGMGTGLFLGPSPTALPGIRTPDPPLTEGGVCCRPSKDRERDNHLFLSCDPAPRTDPETPFLWNSAGFPTKRRPDIPPADVRTSSSGFIFTLSQLYSLPLRRFNIQALSPVFRSH